MTAIFDLIPDKLHIPIQFIACIRSAVKTACYFFHHFVFHHFVFQLFLVTQLMLQISPEIHCQRSDLDLRSYPFLLILKKDGDLHDQMQAAVSARFRFFDIILFLYQPDIVLCQNAAFYKIYIFRESADYPQPCYIPDVFSIDSRVIGSPFLFNFRMIPEFDLTLDWIDL